MKRGTVALVENAVEPETLRWLAREPAVCVSQIPGTTFQYLGMNFRDPTLARREVRRAIALAIDRDALVTHLLGGTAEPASGLLSPAHWAFEGDVTRHRHHPAEARRLLDAAGFPDPDGDGPAMRLRLSYKTTTLDSRRRIAEALQAELAEVGIGLDIRSFEWGTFYDDIRRGDFQLYALAWVGVSDPDIYRSVLASDMTPPRGNNRGAYRNDEIDRLTQLGRTTLDPLERRRIYGDVQRLTAEDLPFVPLWWTDNVVVQDRRLCGFVPYPDGDLVSLRTAWWNDSPAPAENGRPSPCGCAAGAASRGEPPRE
jgi:peptide/nickel transport system substrate-binding protein